MNPFFKQDSRRKIERNVWRSIFTINATGKYPNQANGLIEIDTSIEGKMSRSELNPTIKQAECNVIVM